MSEATDDVVVWYCADAGAVEGPLTRERVVDLIRSGRLGRGMLCWREGLASWEPLTVHFGEASETPPAIATADHVPQRELRADIRVFRSPPRVLLPRLVIPVVALAGLVTLSFVQTWLLPVGDARAVTALWLAMLAATAGFLVVSIRQWWPRSQPGTASSNWSARHAGVIKALCVCAGFVGGIALVVFGSQTPLLYRITLAREAYAKYTVDVDVLAEDIRITGMVGPGIATKVGELLDVHAGIRRLTITSPGGLLDEGLTLARLIERRPNLVVVARKECNSACLLIIAAGKARAADFNMDFGFHAASPITPLDDLLAASVAEEATVADEFLKSHGISQSIIDQKNAIGPDALAPVSSISLRQSGFLSQLLDGDEELPILVAKWRVVEDDIGNRSKGLAAVICAIRTTIDAAVSDYAERLYTAYRSRDPRRLAEVMKALISEVRSFGLDAANDAEVLDFLHSNVQTADYLISVEAWTGCVSYMLGTSGSPVSVPPPLREAEMTSLAALIRSAAMANWHKRSVPSWAASEWDALVLSIGAKLVTHGLDPAAFDSTPRGNCLFYRELFAEIIAIGPVKGVALYRYANSLGSSKGANVRTAQTQKQGSGGVPSGPLKIGDTVNGYVYLGGHPNDRNSWQRHGE